MWGGYGHLDAAALTQPGGAIDSISNAVREAVGGYNRVADNRDERAHQAVMQAIAQKRQDGQDERQLRQDQLQEELIRARIKDLGLRGLHTAGKGLLQSLGFGGRTTAAVKPEKPPEAAEGRVIDDINQRVEREALQAGQLKRAVDPMTNLPTGKPELADAEGFRVRRLANFLQGGINPDTYMPIDPASPEALAMLPDLEPANAGQAAPAPVAPVADPAAAAVAPPAPAAPPVRQANPAAFSAVTATLSQSGLQPEQRRLLARTAQLAKAGDQQAIQDLMEWYGQHPDVQQQAADADFALQTAPGGIGL
jgi:hypothetical protein